MGAELLLGIRLGACRSGGDTFALEFGNCITGGDGLGFCGIGTCCNGGVTRVLCPLGADWTTGASLALAT